VVTNVDAVTVFNGRTDSVTRRKKYIPTVIRGVSCVESKGSTVTNSGVWSADVQYRLRIPADAGIQHGRIYVQEARYAGLDDGEAGSCWTAARGDMVALGDCTGSGSPQMLYEDEIQKLVQGHGFSLFRITEYADNTSGGHPCTRHWRIGGK
jgi:hypothetical protein